MRVEMGSSHPSHSERAVHFVHVFASLKPAITARRTNFRDPEFDKLAGVPSLLMSVKGKASRLSVWRQPATNAAFVLVNECETKASRQNIGL